MPAIIVTLIGIMATVFAVSSSIPQIIKSIRTRKTDDVSIWLVIVLIIGLSLWVVYGIGINDLVIIIANSIAVCINTILLILKIKYSKDPVSWSFFIVCLGPPMRLQSAMADKINRYPWVLNIQLDPLYLLLKFRHLIMPTRTFNKLIKNNYK